MGSYEEKYFQLLPSVSPWALLFKKCICKREGGINLVACIVVVFWLFSYMS